MPYQLLGMMPGQIVTLLVVDVDDYVENQALSEYESEQVFTRDVIFDDQLIPHHYVKIDDHSYGVGYDIYTDAVVVVSVAK